MNSAVVRTASFVAPGVAGVTPSSRAVERPDVALEGTLDATVTDHGVEFTHTVENADDEPVEITFRSGKHADVAVYDASDPEGLPRRALSKDESGAETQSGTPHDDDDPEEVWRWSDGRLFTQALESRTLDPGETATFTFTWEGAEPGEYVGVATLDADADCLASAEFSV